MGFLQSAWIGVVSSYSLGWLSTGHWVGPRIGRIGLRLQLREATTESFPNTFGLYKVKSKDPHSVNPIFHISTSWIFLNFRYECILNWPQNPMQYQITNCPSSVKEIIVVAEIGNGLTRITWMSLCFQNSVNSLLSSWSWCFQYKQIFELSVCYRAIYFIRLILN